MVKQSEFIMLATFLFQRNAFRTMCLVHGYWPLQSHIFAALPLRAVVAGEAV